VNLPLAEWLPRSSAVNLLAGAFLLSALFAAGQRRMSGAITAYAWNSASLALVAAVVAAQTGARHIWIAAILVFATKALVIPAVLRRASARGRAPGPPEPPLGSPAALLVAGALVVVGFGVTRPLFGASPTILASCLPVSVAAMLVGLFVMVSHTQALMQVLGLVLVENAIFLAAVSLTYGMPLVVEMGVLLDVLAGVALLGMWVGRIEEAFETSDTARMTSLQDHP
jgi:hydrogenase-4 component E